MDNGLTFLYVASLIIVIAILVYVASLFAKQKQVQKEIASLKDMVKLSKKES